MTPYRIKRHRKRANKVEGGNHMTLVPFIDMLMILMVFLLVHTSDVEILPNPRNISIPQSVSETKPRATVVVMITRDDLLVDGRVVARVADLAASADPVIEPLRQVLMSQADTVLATADASDASRREITILGDRHIPYSVLRRVMATCTEAQYAKVSLAVIERERATAPARAAQSAG